MNLDSMLKTITNIYKLCELYGFDDDVTDIGHILNGHINDTYRITIGDPDEDHRRLIFQKVNDYIFREPAKIMSNIDTVARWLDAHETVGDCRILSFLYNKAGANYQILEDGSFWRISELVPHSVTHEKADSEDVLRGAGYAFGRFQVQLHGIPMDGLYETIPDFHNTVKRVRHLFDVADVDEYHRADEVKAELDYFRENADYFSTLQRMKESGELPTRVVHNDTKINNILFNRLTGAPIAVIDLDTIMPGLSAHDFGDAVRCAANYSAEDETDLSKVGLNFNMYRAFTKGYITATREILTVNEVKTMALGAPTLAFELASRFLADYLEGDCYFRIHHEKHNLERARCQLDLCKKMLAQYDKMSECVGKYYS